MKLDYSRVESTVRPEEITFDGTNVRLTRNVQEEVRQQTSSESTLYYVYDEAVLTPEAFQVYASIGLITDMSKLDVFQDGYNAAMIILGGSLE